MSELTKYRKTSRNQMKGYTVPLPPEIYDAIMDLNSNHKMRDWARDVLVREVQKLKSCGDK